MLKKDVNVRGNILIELVIKGYTENFLKVFFIFFKQRFFKNFVKTSNKKIVFNRYTLLRSSFVNKSSREQIEKRIYKKKINLVFSEFDFKYFYSNLSSLNFKGISLKMSKFFFLDPNPIVTKVHNFLKKKDFKFFWDTFSLDKKKSIIQKLKNKNLHQVFPLIGLEKQISKKVSLKFLKKKSFFKNRLRSGLFHVSAKKLNLIKKDLFFFKLFSKNQTLNKNSFINSNFSVLSLSYSYNFLSCLENTNSNEYKRYSLIFQKNLLKEKSLFNSIYRYRNFFVWSSFNNSRKRNDFRGGLSRINLIDKFNLNLKLILGLKLNPFQLKYNLLFKNSFNLLSNEDKNFFLFLKNMNEKNLFELSKIIYIKSLILKKGFRNLLEHLSKIKTKSLSFSTNPWLVRRSFLKNLGRSDKELFLKDYEKNNIIKSIQNTLYFRYKPLVYFILLYQANKKNSTGNRKIHLEKRFRYLLKRNWGLIWRIKTKNRFFFKKRKKKNFWKIFHRNFKNKHQKKKIKFKKIKRNFRVKYKKKQKRFNNVFSVFIKR